MAMARRRKLHLLKGEKMLYSFTLFLVIGFLVFTVFTKASLSKLNIEVERLKIEVSSTEKTIESLSMKVNELASLDNVSQVAESMGLSYNNSNIKVVD